MSWRNPNTGHETGFNDWLSTPSSQRNVWYTVLTYYKYTHVVSYKIYVFLSLSKNSHVNMSKQNVATVVEAYICFSVLQRHGGGWRDGSISKVLAVQL